MFLLDEPYVSDFLAQTIQSNGIPVIDTAAARQFLGQRQVSFVSETAAVEKITAGVAPRLYSNSENAIGWISKNLSGTTIPETIDIFKNKARFRRLIAASFPDFFYKEISLNEMPSLDTTDLPFPFIIKPTTGFFSMAVHKVTTPEEWPAIHEQINNGIEAIQGIYPEEVMNTGSFIIEECIKGDEFAVDAYFNDEGTPVILGIYQHLFASDMDVSDRVYMTSAQIIHDNLSSFTQFLASVGKQADIKNFPVHVELRVTTDGTINPIEVNPMRFGGWCTTADMTATAWNFNPYTAYLNDEKPDWKNITAGKEGLIYSIIVLDNSTGIEGRHISSFNWNSLKERFHNPLAHRPVDYNAYPLFGFLFSETPSDRLDELQYILGSDLREFISLE